MLHLACHKRPSFHLLSREIMTMTIVRWEEHNEEDSDDDKERVATDNDIDPVIAPVFKAMYSLAL
jgi:hypothetical protein